MKNLLRETFSHHRAGRQLAWPQPPVDTEDLLVVAPPNLLIIIFSITLSSQKEGMTTEGRGGKRKRVREREREGWRERGRHLRFTCLLETVIASHYHVL